MPDMKISELTVLGAAPALTDLVEIVDVSEPAADDRSKSATVANLFDTPTISDLTNAQHDHSDAAAGGQISGGGVPAIVCYENEAVCYENEAVQII